MKTILWVTPDYFADVDIPIVPLISRNFRVHWVILRPANPRYKDSDYLTIVKDYPNLSVDIVVLDRERYPSNLFKYYKITSAVRNINPDVTYFNVVASTPWLIPMLYTLPKNRTIVTAHQGRIHEGMKDTLLNRTMRSIMYGRFKNVHMFSKSQASLFKETYPKSRIFLSQLGLKYFGEPSNTRPSEGKVRFLSFGIINYTKNIDLLIDAACLLHERGIKNFIVSINGMCKNWDWYQERVKYPEIFNLDIRMIDNEEIPNLFNSSHYLVQPYRVVSQSGPTKIAFQYNLPVLSSNLPGFTDEIVEGVNGYYFEKGNVEDLADKMQMLIENHQNYNALLEAEKEYTKKTYSKESLVAKYEEMFDEIIRKNE